jgi:hypothetical protein
MKFNLKGVAMTRQVGVSNSEAMNAYACELAWGFGHHPEMNYQKRDASDARMRGIIGHAALQVYYEGLRDGQDHDVSAQAALSHIQSLRVKEITAGDFMNIQRLEMLNWLHRVLNRYFEHYESDADDYEILEVEGFHAQEFEGEVDFYLPSRIDVTVYHKRGEFKGETSPLDHKFTSGFWAPFKVDLNSQFPLYIRALRASRFAGKPQPVVKRVIVNQINTKIVNLDNYPSDSIFRRILKPYDSDRIERVFQNHLKMAVHLAYLKRLSWEEAREEISAALGSMACQYCDFKDLCDITFEGKDPSNVIEATLEKNDYGYPPLEEIRRERT